MVGFVALRRRSFGSLRAIIALMLREMSSTYGRTPLGYLWAILEPVVGISLLTLVFMAILHAPPIGNNFAIFYATGMLPFLLYMEMSNKVMQSMQFSTQLLVYPSVTFVDALLARFFLTLLTQILVMGIVFAGLMALFDTRTQPDILKIALAISMVAALGFGVGSLNCVLVGFAPSWARIWAIANRPMFLISCIFFPYEAIPLPYRDWLWYNPLVHVVGQMRHGFYPYYDAAYVSLLYVFGLALGLSATGLLFLWRYYRDILHR
ncbi:MAG: ABC transporter permease [Pseudomonadota bacterium]